ncbi:hypothetical protein [Natronococcus occultus]|uniref:Uncharacterized protein n=1 Tax=Natronococcus occultus SP4 TaxID=694430 RepID=L0K6M4_9EURY|nr:hypothetical protein [Natronococcus occultus]AGB40014.1 hypothetical protein Natoc_4324 [Natronococcus occultus SP4]
MFVADYGESGEQLLERELLKYDAPMITNRIEKTITTTRQKGGQFNRRTREGRRGFPPENELIGEVEASVGHTTIDEIESELGQGTFGSLQLDPSSLMNDAVAHDSDGEVIVC